MMMSVPPRYNAQEFPQHLTIEQSVVQRLQEAITQGRLVPGQKLVYADIAEQMNVSVTPVREAVKTLQALGLVTIRPHRTAFVSSLTEEQVQQLYSLRLLLEGLAVERTVEDMTADDVSHLKNVYEEMDRVVEVLNRDVNDVVRTEAIVSLQHLHNDFHSSLYSRSGNQYLDQVIKVLRSQVATYWPVINRYSIERVNMSHRQHFAILTASEQRKPAEASKLMRSHLEGTVPWIIEHIRAVNTEAGEGKTRKKHVIIPTVESRPGQ
jgi:DNA-binding GntR family transcriptional regulator